METKSILVSKTFWFNVATAILYMADAREIVDVLPTAAQAYVPALVAAVNICLRIATVQPVTITLRTAQ